MSSFLVLLCSFFDPKPLHVAFWREGNWRESEIVLTRGSYLADGLDLAGGKRATRTDGSCPKDSIPIPSHVNQTASSLQQVAGAGRHRHPLLPLRGGLRHATSTITMTMADLDLHLLPSPPTPTHTSNTTAIAIGSLPSRP